MTLLLLLLACQAPTLGPAATLETLAAIDDVEAAGWSLIHQPMGLHRLDDADHDRPVAVVAVHGMKSQGKEWVEPLRLLGKEDVELYFLRWDFMQCPQDSADDLQRAMAELDDGVREKIVVVGHSYGGLATFLYGQEYPNGTSRELHAVAAPLGEHPQIQRRCGFNGVPEQPTQDDTSWSQWRTAHAQDGAFKDLDDDPQLVYLPELEVHRLPETWQGERLGHNRSVTWFVKESGFLTSSAD